MYFTRDGERFDDRREAIGRRSRRDDRQRAFAISAVQDLQQVGLFGLGRQARAGAAALDVDDNQRHFGHHRKAHRFSFQRDAGPDVPVQPSAPPKLAPMAAPTAAISSSAWNVIHAHVLVGRETVQDVAGGA